MNWFRKMPVASLYAVGAFTSYVISDVCVKLCGKTIEIDQSIFLNKFVFVITCFVVAMRGQGLKKLRIRKPFFHFARGLICVVNMIMFFYGVRHLPLANFYTINFMTPLMVACLSALFLKEKAGLGVWAAIVAGFIGVVIAVRPEHYDALAWPLLPVIALFVGNFCFAIYALTIKWGGTNESSEALVLYPEVVCLAVLFLFVLIKDSWPHDPVGIVFALLSGVFSAGGGLLLTAAYRRAINAHVAPFHYTQIISGSLAGYFLFGDVPTLYVLTGVAIIVASGLYIMRKTHEPEIEAGVSVFGAS